MAEWMEFSVKTRAKNEFIDITNTVEELLANTGIDEGYGIIFIPHTTAGLTINENADPDVVRDLLMAFEHVVPDNLLYRHGEGNSPAHLKASLVGMERMVPVRGGRLALGTWQGIYLCEFDGPRIRRVMVSWCKF
jgi:secondary thiamine-phosphate synthase enzyme